MRMRKVVNSKGKKLPDGRTLKLLRRGKCYKYQGLMTCDRVLNGKMKTKIEECNRIQQI